MCGYASVTDVPYRIDSRLEGRFDEVIRRGSFARTLREDRDRIRCLFSHGHDKEIGEKPLGRIAKLEEDAVKD